MSNYIKIKNAYANNLKNINVDIPKNKLVVITGLSGSGKSTLAFDILNNECQRQYMESLGMVTDGMSKAKCDEIIGLTPSISINQHIHNKNPRSTIGTITEIYTYLRILFAKLGKKGGKNLGWSMSDFSFNKPDGACPKCTGLGKITEVNLSQVIDESKSIVEGAVYYWDIHYIKRYTEILSNAARHYGYAFDCHQPIKEYNEAARTLFLYGVNHPRMKELFQEVKPPKTSLEGNFEGIITNLKRRYSEKANNKSAREKLEKYFHETTCPDCHGMRLKEAVRDVEIAGVSIIEVQKMSIKEVYVWISSLKKILNEEEWTIAEPVISDVVNRIEKLLKVGVGYLSLLRSVPSLSMGEAQRLRLANLLSSGLTGVLYILDEPTKGLHGKDIDNMIDILQELRDMGNHLLVIEHHYSVIQRADYIIDMGPASGKHGGHVIATGTVDEISANQKSLTGKYLREHVKIESFKTSFSNGFLEIRDIHLHNVKSQSLRVPKNKLIGVAGVSGAGKSTVFMEVLAKEGLDYQKDSRYIFQHCKDIQGLENIKGIRMINQKSVGRTTRSNPATYTGIYDDIRKCFASVSKAKELKLSASFFSFNTPGGRCEHCEGSGTIVMNMHFLPDVKVACPVCKGQRYNETILSVKYNGYSIYDVLELTVEEALGVFKAEKKIRTKLQILSDVGLDYLHLGQEVSTLSGGEAQRIKLAKDLIDDDTTNLLYIIDEPSAGLHFHDCLKVLNLFQKLVHKGNTVIYIEHHPLFLLSAEHLVELGPGGGKQGGKVVFEGSPAKLIAEPKTYTGQFLKEVSARYIKLV